MSWIVLFTALIAANLASFEVLTPSGSTIAVYNGQVKGWGKNNGGQLVTGNTDTQLVPTGPFDLGPDSTGSDFLVEQLDCGSTYCCALSPAKSLKCWGYSIQSGYANSAYDNGVGDEQDEVGNIPLVTAVDNVVDMVALGGVFCVLMQQEGAFSLECVGDDYGAYILWPFHDPTVTWEQTVTWDSGPVAVSGFEEKTAGWTDVKLGGGQWNLCVFDPNLVDALECWGAVSGDLWEEDKVAGRAFQAVNCGCSHCCALTVDQELTCWGLNSVRTDMSIINNFGPIQDFSTACGSTCALSTSGKIGCFGVSSNGQLGEGSWDIPQRFSTSGARLAHSGGTADHYCLYEETATELLLECWGSNYYGQLGTESTDLGWEVVPPPSPSPTPAPTPAPTPSPTPAPSPSPTPAPTPNPTPAPTPNPTPNPTPAPTPNPTPAPTPNPTPAPTPAPTPNPTPAPSPAPTPNPTPAPTVNPTKSPTAEPTDCCGCPEPTTTESVSAHYIARGSPTNGNFDDGQVSFHCHDDENNQALYSSTIHGYNIGVGCCDENGSVGDRPDCDSHPATYQQAFNLCAENGQRLCTLQQTISGVTKGKGCNYDAAYQWVSDSCSVPAIRSLDAAAMSVPALIAETSESKESVADFTFVTLGAVMSALVVTVIMLIVVVIRRKRRMKQDDGIAMSEVTAPKVEPVQSADGIYSI